MIRALVALVALVAVAWAGSACTSAAWAQDQPMVAPDPSWIKPIELPTGPVPAGVTVVRILTINEQARFTPAGPELYHQRSMQILAPEALRLGMVSTEWDPATETLIINHLRIIRDGKTIDVLANGQTFNVVHREPDLDSSMLYGRLTAFIEPDDVQVGDIIDFAFTIQRHDPTFAGHMETEFIVPSPYVTIERAYYRAIWPQGVNASWRETKGMEAPKTSKTADGGGELVLDMKDVNYKTYPSLMSASGGLLQVSDYARWEDVSRQFAPLYAKAETLAPDSPLKAEVAKIAAASTDPEVRAGAALDLVQEKVRYVFNGINRGGYVPADADVTWRRRFGDCKGKSALLVALLHELGIQAEVALVSTAHSTQVGDSQPGAHVFDHVIVRATIDGQVFWLDPTHMHEADVELVGMPRFKYALPISDAGAGLEPLQEAKPEKPLHEYHIAYDASAGLDAPAPVHVEVVYRGEAANAERRRFTGVDDAARDRLLRSSLPSVISKRVDISKVGYSYDRANREVHETLDGATVMSWIADPAAGGVRSYSVDRSTILKAPSIPPPAPLPPVVHPVPHVQTQVPPVIAPPHLGEMAPPPPTVQPRVINVPPPAPLPPIVHPMPVVTSNAPSAWQYDRTFVTVTLPRGGAGYSLEGADISKSVTGHQYTRVATVKDGVFNLDLVSRTTQHDITSSEEAKARREMADFAGDVKIKAPLGFKASLVETEIRAKRAADTPVIYRDRADARVETGDFDGAMKDLDEALKLKADDAVTLNERCFLRAEANRDLKDALADCDKALGITPRRPDIIDSRGLVHYRMGQFDLAVKDYEEAIGLDSSLPSPRFMHGVVLHRLGRAKEGDDEIAAGEKLDPSIAASYARYGIAP
ncbi:MAG TPA: DUF3857 domain-containing protein [Caulobacteraceae bacterium]|jgi:Flp pilus assembly protein TadD|nr:DUF3857 domain-containing protein [Caulobacteraceae bacterium]